MTEQPEFSRLIAIEGIMPDKLRQEEIEATPEECAALAERFGIRSLSGLSARLSIRRVTGDAAAVRIECRFEADIVQACVVSLQDIPAHIDGKFDTYFTEKPGEEGGEVEFSHDDEESTPEMVTNGNIDMGEVVAQYLSLEIDPYPRAPGVSLAAQLAESGIKQKESPFQVLEKLKDTSKKADK